MFNHVAAVIQYMKDKRRLKRRPGTGKHADQLSPGSPTEGPAKDGRGDG